MENVLKVETDTKVVNFPESTNRTRSQTITIPNLKAIHSMTVNTGTVSYSITGNSVLITVQNGAYTSLVQTGGSPADTKTANLSGTGYLYSGDGACGFPPNNWSTTKSYSDAQGYSGTLSATDATMTSRTPYTCTKGSVTHTYYKEDYSIVYSGTVSKPDTRTYQYYYAYTVTMNYSANAIPNLSVQLPSNNHVISEGTYFSIQGTSNDPDSGNVLTVKYKINNGPSQALQSGVSDGSTPLSFAKTLTYSNKRMRDGATDVTGADLAENVDHTLTVWAEDDQGGKSTEEIRKFRVIHNRAPSISDENRELGSISTVPSITYTVTDPEQNSFTITEKINGNTIRTFSGVANQQETITIPASQWLRLEPGVPHTLTITATDNSGLTSNRVFTFTRVVEQIMFEGLETPMETDIAAERILLTPDWTIPLGAEVRVEACNNGFDAEPIWEDCTIPAKMGRGFAFLNTAKTAEKWGVNFRVRITKGNSTSEASFSGIGGAYDVQ